MDNSQSWAAPRKSPKLMWTCLHSENLPTQRRRAILIRAANAALLPGSRLHVRAAPGAMAWRNADCRVPIHAPAVPSVASRRAPARNVFLAPKRHAAVPAVPRLHVNLCFVNKHRVSLSFSILPQAAAETKNAAQPGRTAEVTTVFSRNRF